MYQRREIRDGRSGELETAFEKRIAALRRSGRVPGRFASSTLSVSSVACLRIVVGEPGGAIVVFGLFVGWEMLF